MKYAIITDQRVEELYGKLACKKLLNQGYEVELFSFPEGEKNKTRETKQALEDALIERSYTRKSTIIALGGGVVIDLAGFLASTFCRGVPLILIPTTLLAMVDASIGGKNGVNTRLGKNMIGTFYSPHQIILNLSYLSTLPDEEWFNGKVEMLKAALIGDPVWFQSFHQLPLEQGIQKAIAIKQEIVNADPQETKGIRSILNLGHTLGHAIEQASQYTIPHGQAVFMGIHLEAQIAHEMNGLDRKALQLLKETFPPISLPLEVDLIMQALYLDKKSEQQFPCFTLLKEIGSAVSGVQVPLKLVKKILHDATLRFR